MGATGRSPVGAGYPRLRHWVVIATAMLVFAQPTPSRAALKDVYKPAYTEHVCVHDARGAVIGPCHDVVHPAVPNAGYCTRAFREWSRGSAWHDDDVTVCQEYMGLNKYCADRGMGVSSRANPDGTLALVCIPPYHHDTIDEQFVHIWTGIGEGLITAAPFVGEAVAGVACLYGQIYACAVLALDVSTQAGLQIPGEVGEAIQVAAQVPQCLDGDVVACAKFGVHGARIVGLDIPGMDKVLLGEDVAKCAADDFAACMRLGQAASEASGIDAGKIVGVIANAQDCADGKKEACIALGKEAARGTPLQGVPDGAESASACNDGSTADCLKLGKTLASAASGLVVEAPFVAQFGANTCTSIADRKGIVGLASAWDDRNATSIAVFSSDGAHFTAPYQASRRNGGWSPTAKFAAADFTGDGTTDILAAWDDNGSNTLTVRQSSARGFAPVHWAIRAGTWVDGTVWLPGDFDGDGHMDVAGVWQDQGLTSIAVYVSDGSRFRAPVQWSVRAGGWGDDTKWTSGDFNGDGKTDLAAVWNNGGSNTLTVWQSTGSSFAQAHWATNAGGWSPTTVWLGGDYNGDGHLDLAAVWHDGDATSIAVYPSNGRQFLYWSQWSQRDGGWIEKAKWASGDFDGDGKADIAAIWDNGGSNTLTVRKSNGSSFTQAHWATNAGGWSPSSAWCVGLFPRLVIAGSASFDESAAESRARHAVIISTPTPGTVSKVDEQRQESVLPRVAAPARALGRVQPAATRDPTRTLCDQARSARARNSPAAPALERQCLQGGGSMAPPP